MAFEAAGKSIRLERRIGVNRYLEGVRRLKKVVLSAFVWLGHRPQGLEHDGLGWVYILYIHP